MKKILEKLEKVFRDKLPHVANSFHPGATEPEIKSLLSECNLNEADLGSLLALFRWHNGQPKDERFLPEEKFSMLSIEDAIKAWHFLCAESDDLWPPSCIPFLYGGGDYLGYETKGDDSHKVLGFWHSDEELEVEYNSLQEWAEEALDELTDYEKPAGTKAVYSYEKVNVLLVKAPAQGAKAIKTIKDGLSLAQGLGQLLRECKSGPVRIISGVYYMSVVQKVQKLNEQLGLCLAIEKADGSQERLPIID